MDYAQNELKEKITKARAVLSRESREAIDSVDWKSMIVGMRESKKFSFTQIETLGIATEMILAGLMSGKEYKQELKSKMALSEEDTNALVAEMNEKVFKKIKENLVSRLGEKRTSSSAKILDIPQAPIVQISNEEKDVFTAAGINLEKDPPKEAKWAEGLGAPSEMIAQIENPSLIKNPEQKPAVQILEKKLTAPFQLPAVKTEHKMDVPLTPTKQLKVEPAPKAARPTLPTEDPYREPTE